MGEPARSSRQLQASQPTPSASAALLPQQNDDPWVYLKLAGEQLRRALYPVWNGAVGALQRAAGNGQPRSSELEPDLDELKLRIKVVTRELEEKNEQLKVREAKKTSSLEQKFTSAKRKVMEFTTQQNELESLLDGHQSRMKALSMHLENINNLLAGRPVSTDLEGINRVYRDIFSVFNIRP